MGKKCCKKIFNRCVCWKPNIKTCCKQVPDVVCNSKNAACKAAQKTYKTSLRAAEGAVDTTRNTLKKATNALDAANVAFDAAQRSLTAIKATLEGVKKNFATGLKASEFIVSYGLNGLIVIRKIAFDVSLAVADGGRFSGSLSATILGKDVNRSVDIHLRSIMDIAKSIADTIGNGFSSLF